MYSFRGKFLLVLILGIVWELLAVIPVKALEYTITSSTDFSAGEYSGIDTDSREGEMKLEADGNWSPRIYKTPDLTLTDGTAILSDVAGTFLLVGHDVVFYKYLPAQNSWRRLADAPAIANTGSDMIQLGNYIYAEFGGYQKVFARYSIATNKWQKMGDMPDWVQGGASLQTDGTRIYALRGTGNYDFWRYTPATDSWSTLLSPPATISVGADLIFDNSAGPGYLYTPRGGNTTTFYRYDIGANSWATMAVVPGAMSDTGNMTKKDGYIYVLRGSNTNSFYRYKIADGTWQTLVNTPWTTRYVGVTYNQQENLIYVFRGNGFYDWWKYDDVNKVFTGELELPAVPGSGADLVYLNGHVYYRRGNSSSSFYDYNLSTDTWTTLGTAPASFNDDNKGIKAGNSLYYYRGGNVTTFYEYDTTGVGWTGRMNTPATVSYGASLVYLNGYIYGTRGGMNRTFWRYKIGVGETWDDGIVTDLPVGSEVGYGSRLVTDGTDIYMIAGQGISNFLKYSVSGNTWTVIGQAPFTPYWGTDLVYYNGKIYAQSGYYKTEVWEYDLSLNRWRSLTKLSGTYVYNVGPYTGGSLAVDSDHGVLYSISGQNVLNLWAYQLSSYDYKSSGSWVSPIIDLGYVSGFNSLGVDGTFPAGTGVAWETKTSSDNVTWSNWSATSGTTINSTVARYIQIKAVFSSNSSRSETPIVLQVSVNYSGDTIAPNNVGTVYGLSQAVGGVTLSSGSTYVYSNPKFSWSAASDNGLGVKGYYVYFGVGETANPVTMGNFQTDTDYVVTVPMDEEVYYLRITTEDLSGNKSATETKFVYSYNGVLSLSVGVSGQSDLATGLGTSATVAGGEIKLQSKPGFWQQKRVALAPNTFRYGASFAYKASTNKLYTFRGNNTNSFYEYDIGSDTWSVLPNAPGSVNTGGDLVEGPDGYLYGLPGLNSNAFWRYSIGTTTWSDAAAADPPLSFSYGSSLIYDGHQYIYALRGNNDDALMRYDTYSDTWDTLANVDFGAPTQTLNNNVYVGGDLAFDGENLYAIQGNYLTGFSIYNIAGNSWQVLPNLPAIPYDGSQIVYDDVTNAIYYISGWTNPFLYKYNIGSQIWEKLPDAPAAFSGGAALRRVGRLLYALRGGTTNVMWVFDIDKQSWLTPTWGIFGTEFRGTDYRQFGYGAQIVKGDGSNYYMMRGNYDNLFVKYNDSTGEVTKLTGAPGGYYSGSAITYVPGQKKIYTIASQYIHRLWIYDIDSDSWSEDVGASLPVTTSTGSSLEFDGTDKIYWIPGGNRTNFYVYDLGSTATNKWMQKANLPAAVSYGAHLAYKSGYLYTLRGNNIANNPFYRYNPADNTWATMAPLPIDAYYDATLVDGGGDYLVACKAENTSLCYRYSIGNNSWENIVDAPANAYQGAAAASDGSEKMLFIAGNGTTNTYNNGLYSYIYSTDKTSFVSNGKYEGSTEDLGDIYRFANLEMDYKTDTSGAFTVDTRTSDDGETYSNWTAVSEGKTIDGGKKYFKINSPPARYAQVRVNLISDNEIYSPAILGYRINYYRDQSDPFNPTRITVLSSQTSGVSIGSTGWHNYPAPFFDWPEAETDGGATDGLNGSGIKGYWVYLGTNELASVEDDPDLWTYTTDSKYQSSNLISGTTYYFKIRTVDDAGRLSASDWKAFTYKYDGIKPTNPTTVTVDPPGYTANNLFNISWTAAEDEASGIFGYCFKTAQVGVTETCTSDIGISGVPSYKTGTNTMMIRSKDNAGNYANDYVTVSYYYSSDAPGAPKNLRVTSEATNSVNEFAFAWDPPDLFYGQQSALRYYYSINTPPQASNVNQVGLAVTYLSSGAYATQKGVNALYVVVKDEAGNIDYNSYATVEFTADTEAPGIPLNLDISDVSIKETKSWRLALSWDAPEASGSGVAKYRVYRSGTEGAVCSSNFEDFTYVAETTQVSYVDTGLTQSKKYYCIKACDSTNECSAPSSTVALFPDGRWRVAPSLEASPSASVKTKSAIIEWVTGRTASSFVKYGKSSGDYGDEVGSSDQLINHVISLAGLDPGTTYYYKALWTDEDGNTGESLEYSLTTNPAPAVATVKVSDVSMYSVYINFELSNATSATIQYGETSNYGEELKLNTSKETADHSVKLEDLSDGTVYHLRIVAEDEEGNVFSSDDYEFETLPVPKVTDARLQQVKGTATSTVRIVWKSNTGISSIVTYYPKGKPEMAKDQIILALATNHQIIISDLWDDTDYVFVVKGKDVGGNEATAEIINIKTATDLRPPQISELRSEASVNGVGDAAKAAIVVSWNTDEGATSQIEFGEGTGGDYPNRTQEDGNLTENHTVTITELKPGTVYHLRVVTKDKMNNLSQSYDNVVVTPKATKSALDLVVNSLSKSFTFFNGLSSVAK